MSKNNGEVVDGILWTGILTSCLVVMTNLNSVRKIVMLTGTYKQAGQDKESSTSSWVLQQGL